MPPEVTDTATVSSDVCGKTKLFRLGERSSAMVTCGLYPDHNGKHMGAENFDDGSQVVFRWDA